MSKGDIELRGVKSSGTFYISELEIDQIRREKEGEAGRTKVWLKWREYGKLDVPATHLINARRASSSA